MKVALHFKKINADFDQGFADYFYEGEEGDGNPHFEWEDEIEVTGEVESFKILNRAEYTLAGSFPDGNAFEFTIGNMTLCECKLESGEVVLLGASRKLVAETDKQTDEESGRVTFTFFLKGNLDIPSPFPGLYVHPDDLPEALADTPTA